MAGGDTIWRDEIAADLLKLRPDVVVLNAGYAHVIGFGPIIMGKEDLLNVHFTLPEAKIMAIHGSGQPLHSEPGRRCASMRWIIR